MRLLRPALAAAALAATAGTAPAHAAIFPVCEAELVNAAAGTSTYCDTQAPTRTDSSGGWTRTVTVTVATGAVSGNLDCALSWVRSFTATPTQPASFAMGDTRFCRLNLTATANGTTAVATSTTAYHVHPE